jgi:ketol-acid reductoisomerase
MALIDFGGVKEEVITRREMPLSQARQILERETVGIIGYGPQGYGQSLNLRDNGIKVLIGQRRGGRGWDDALRDGWVEGQTLFENISHVVRNATIVEYLLSDAGQKEQWPVVRDNLRNGQALCFSHGFSVVFKDQTGVSPPGSVDVVLIAPKGAGRTVRSNFLAASTQDFLFFMIRLGVSVIAWWPWAWRSVRAISSPPPSKRKSTAT